MWKAAITTLLASIGVLAVAALAMKLLIAWSTVEITAVTSHRQAPNHCRAPNDRRLLPNAPLLDRIDLAERASARRPRRSAIGGGRDFPAAL